MKCSVCKDKMIQRQDVIELKINGKLFLVENVPYEECLSCGERVLAPNVSQEIFSKVTRKEYREKQMFVPVVENIKARAV
ncbi:YgiT-type zinc finger protein [Desulfonatronospira sp.]|uniref:YgiT-type zinc finger protein n=1 Tax=Desulfonatronospira sp. TaxID=1962951 RepID=UPI0025C34126|nr:YgiT-type zinc finger protein [Desulfonatronospira sp.]